MDEMDRKKVINKDKDEREREKGKKVPTAHVCMYVCMYACM